MAAALLSALQQTGGIEAARRLYRALLPLPPPGGEFFRRLLQLEMAAAAEQGQLQGAAARAEAPGRKKGSAAGAALAPRELQDLFEQAADAYGAADVQLWLLYAEWQASRGAAGDVGAVYWKARKALKGAADEFEAAFHLRFKVQPGLAPRL